MGREVFTAKVNVGAPFPFCEKCERMEIEEDVYHLWGTGEQIGKELYCANGPFCRYIIELYEREANK